MKELLIGAGILAFLVIFAFVLVPNGKKLSYRWWYEDMVRTTVSEMVKQEALK